MKMTKMMAGVMAVTAPAVFAQNVAESTFNTGLTVDNGTIAATAPLGVVACTRTRNAMQAMQFVPGSVCDPANTAGHAVFGDSKTCMPSLSTPELNALTRGQIGSTTAITGTYNASNGGNTLRDHLQDNGVPTTQANLVRVNTTAGASDAVGGYAGAAGCVLSGSWPSGATSVADLVSDMETQCNNAKSAKRRGALGIMPISEQSDHFRFLKLDGVAPTLAEHLEGDYNMVINAIGTVTATPTFVHGFGVTGGAAWAPTAGNATAKHNAAAGDFCFQPTVPADAVL